MAVNPIKLYRAWRGCGMSRRVCVAGALREVKVIIRQWWLRRELKKLARKDPERFAAAIQELEQILGDL